MQPRTEHKVRQIEGVKEPMIRLGNPFDDPVAGSGSLPPDPSGSQLPGQG